MRFVPQAEANRPNNTIVIEHRGVELEWGIKTYRMLQVNENIIYDINHYWSLLPIEKQDAIFNIYTEIHELLNNVSNREKLDRFLIQQVAKLFEYHQFDEIKKYYNLKGRIKLPLDLKTSYSEGTVPELTYLQPEYIDLTCLCIAMRIMIPIWGRYIEILISADAAGYFKEYRAASLLRESNIVHSPAYKRLNLYVTTFWNGSTEEHSSAAILMGLPKDEVSDWLISNVLIRRIATAEILQVDQPGEPKMIITAIYNFIESLVTTMDKTFGGRVNDKSLEGSVQGDDDNSSVIENYKIKQEISEGMIKVDDVHLRHHMLTIIKKIDPTLLPDAAAEKAFMEFADMVKSRYDKNFTPNEVGIVLCKWVLYPIVIDKMLDEVSYPAVFNAHLITYALLNHWGFHHAALFIFAKRTMNNLINNTVRQSITEEQLARLQEIYPHSPNNTLKRKLTKFENNVACVGIRTLISPLYGSWWELAPWEDASRYPQLRIDGNLAPLPYDIEPVLADLIIYFNNLDYKAK